MQSIVVPLVRQAQILNHLVDFLARLKTGACFQVGVKEQVLLHRQPIDAKMNEIQVQLLQLLSYQRTDRKGRCVEGTIQVAGE